MSYYYIEKKKSSKAGTSSPRIVNYTRSEYTPSDSNVAFKLHNHDIFELTVVTEGSFTEIVDGIAYKLHEGDIIIANPYELHEGELSFNTRCVYLTLTCSLESFLFSRLGGMSGEIQELLSSRYGFKTRITANEPFAKEIVRHIKCAYESSKSEDSFKRCEAISHTYAVFSLLFEHYYAPLPGGEKRNNKNFFKAVTEYLEENYQRKIGTADISSALYMSESQFCHSFRKYYNESFSKFLCKYRITKAQKDAQSYGKPLGEIARSVGFSSYQYFARAFREILGCSPGEYFKSKKEKNVENGEK